LKNKIRISAVSYTNTAPFVYGLNHSEIPRKTILTLDTPAICAQKLIHDEADIGLVPVAALLNIPNYSIVADYCIGAEGAVNSVFIFSDKPVEEIKTVRLDDQSRTSNNLARVLFKNHWKMKPEYLTSGVADAFVEIGDRTFGKKQRYAYAYDMGEEWMKFTALPFAFAVWAANKPVDGGFVSEFQQALQYGLDHRDEVIAGLTPRSDFDLHDYLINRIRFNFDAPKKEALKKFLSLVSEL
jgi:chorismate dehydratase